MYRLFTQRDSISRTILFKGDADLRVRSPDRSAGAANAFNDHFEIRGNSEGRRYLQAGAGVREIPDRAIELGCLLAKNDLRILEDALAKDIVSFFLHSPASRISVALGD